MRNSKSVKNPDPAVDAYFLLVSSLAAVCVIVAGCYAFVGLQKAEDQPGLKRQTSVPAQRLGLCAAIYGTSFVARSIWSLVILRRGDDALVADLSIADSLEVVPSLVRTLHTACMHVRIHACPHVICTNAHMSYVCMPTYVHFMHARMHACVHACVRACARARACVRTCIALHCIACMRAVFKSPLRSAYVLSDIPSARLEKS